MGVADDSRIYLSYAKMRLILANNMTGSFISTMSRHKPGHVDRNLE